MSKYKVGDIIEKLDGNIAKVLEIDTMEDSSYVVYYTSCQGEHWYLNDCDIKGLAARPAKNRDKVSRFDLMDLE